MWQGVCMTGGMHGRGGIHGRGHVWQGGGACMAGGFVARGCVVGGMHDRGCITGGQACMAHMSPLGRYYEIRSMSGRYASYWNAFLFNNKIGSHYNEEKVP